MSRRRGVILDPAEVPADGRGFLLGDGLFETMRVYGGKPFRLDAHLARLTAGARTLGMEVPGDLEARIAALLDGARREVEPAELEAALRITLGRGPGGDLAGEGAGPPTVALRLVPLEAEGPPGGPEPAPPVVQAMLEGRLHEDALGAGLKGIGYLERVLALRRARERGGSEAILRNSRDELVEGSTSNLAALLPDDLLVSPGPAEGALPGITRAVVLDEARRMGLRVEERGLSRPELPRVREMVLTSSIREVAAVVAVEGEPVGTGRVGPVARDLLRAYRACVERELS